MDDVQNELSKLPDVLRRQIIDYRRAREIGLRELVEKQNRSFLQDVEAEMWCMLTLPGHVQPGLIMAVVEAVLSKEVRKQARINIYEANALRIAAHKQTTRQQETDIRQVYVMSLRARRVENQDEVADLIE